MSSIPLIRLLGVEKHFEGAYALRGVDLDILAGEIHGLVGENGAGKSTLGKIITGVHRPDGGTMELDGTPLVCGSPREALSHGLALVAQELSLAPARSVIDNVMLGREAQRFGVLRKSAMRTEWSELSAGVGFEAPPDTLVRDLRPSDQQKVEIMRAVARKARLIVMDEPTTSLTADEQARLFELARAQAAKGTAIVFVSHELEAVRDLCDRITVLRDGLLVEQSKADETDVETMIKAMIGRPLGAFFPDRRPAAPDAPPVLAVKGLTREPELTDVSFEVRRGEILGIAGLVGSGRSEIARAIFAADKFDSGSVELEGSEVKFRSIRGAVRAGVMMLPESRKEEGLVLGASIRDNVMLPHLDGFQVGGMIRRRRMRERAAEVCQDMGVKGAPLDAPVRVLSGGNQQKVLLAKCLCRSPRLLIVDEPTRGVDVGAKRAIYDLLVDYAEKGLAVILISSDLEEVLGLAHRVIVIKDGRIAGHLEGEELTESGVLGAAFGADTPSDLLQ